MRKATLEKAGLAAAILLLPGGFLLGAALAARHWRARRATSVAAVDKAPGEALTDA